MGAIKKVNGVPWSNGVVANCSWAGVPLRDVLMRCGVVVPQGSEHGMHVCFASYATICEDDSYYGASIPLETALSEDADVLIAYEVRVIALRAETLLLLTRSLSDEWRNVESGSWRASEDRCTWIPWCEVGKVG